ncbi:MAG: flagellar hook assembly protein FlgD [Proteobacteria bacterium]|nr:flagellar hook assembly protein FlgD [Pseudomonadota bacterium]MBU1714230.1 flagellar hook assembly protein FlgD [Pseudomonadota bacterium]
MSVSAVSSIPMATDPELFPATGKKELDRTDFLKLFVTQLQYQDPMKPMDTYEMSSQLAQFSSMEATLKMSGNMEELLAYQTSQNNLQLLQLLDSNVQAFGNMMAMNEGAVGATEFSLLESAESCQVEIYDGGGSLVRSINMGSQGVGAYELAWDGKNQAGDQVDDGLYTYRIKALDEAAREVEVEYRITGKVSGIEFESGQALLTIDKYINVSVSDVLRVM